MKTTAEKIMTVWLDTTSDDHGWIVDTDVVGGGESDTVRVFPPTPAGNRKAVAFAERAAAKRGMRLVIQ